jgi:broad specificity phosphatase PhoE
MIDLFLIRHAECDVNEGNIIGGRIDSSQLTELGIKQANLLKQKFINENIKFDEIYSSPSIRALETAKISCKDLFPVNRIKIINDLNELTQGNWDGKKKFEVYTKKILNTINKDSWNFKAPNGESQKEVEERMIKSIMPLLDRNENLTIGIYSHALAMKCFLRGIFNFDAKHTWKIDIKNTAINKLKYDPIKKWWYLKSINDYGHLNGQISKNYYSPDKIYSK